MKQIALGSTIFTALLLALAFIVDNDRIPALSILVLGVLWSTVVWWRNWGWANDLGLVIFVGLAGFGIWRNLPTLWMLLATVAALIAWDLAHFAQRLATAEPIDESLPLWRPHFERLLMVSGLGLLLGGAAWGFQISLNFGWVVFLGFLMAISLSWVVRVVRRVGSD